MEPPSPEWTSTVGPYRLVRRLGAGGMGVVYLGQDQRSGAEAAVKLIRPEFAADPSFRARLRREVDAARRVPRFCTAPVLDADLDAERPWVATEYVDGPSLDMVLLERGRLTGAALENVAVGVAVALQAVHQHGVIHRDLKPSNILLSPAGPRVIDFGIARIEDQPHLTQLTHTGMVVGTPAFMAPEQLAGQPLTGAADVFAWGSLVAYAATGRPPFGTGEAAPEAIQHGQPELGELAEPLRGLVAEALHKAPAARPSAAELVNRLTRAASETATQVIATATAPPVPPSAVPPPGPTYVPPPGATALATPAGTVPGRRRRGLLLAGGGAGAALAVLTAVTATAIWLSPDDPPPTGNGAGPLPGGGDVAFEHTFTLGGLMPLTGILADFGAGIIAAAELAVQEINEAGGVWGNDVEWVLADEGSSEQREIAAAGDVLIAEGVHAVIGGVSSSASLAVIEAMYHEKIIMVSPSNTAPVLTDHQFGEYYFRTAPSDLFQGMLLAELAIADGHADLAILAERTDYGEALASEIERVYLAGGGEVRYQGFHELGQADYPTEVAALVDADPSAFVLVSSWPDTRRIIEELVAAGFTPQDRQWYFTDTTLFNYQTDFEAGLLAGVRGTLPVARAEPAEFLAEVDAFAGGLNLTAYVTEAYDAVMVVALAAIAADSDDPDAIRDEMVGVTTGGTPCASFAECRDLLDRGQDIDYSGYSGVSWDESGEPAEATIGIFQYGADNTYEQIDTVTVRG